MKKIISDYLYYIDQPELINRTDKIIFLYNGEKINENLTQENALKLKQSQKYL